MTQPSDAAAQNTAFRNASFRKELRKAMTDVDEARVIEACVWADAGCELPPEWWWTTTKECDPASPPDRPDWVYLRYKRYNLI